MSENDINKRICDECGCFIDNTLKCISCGKQCVHEATSYGTFINPYTNKINSEEKTEEDFDPDVNE